MASFGSFTWGVDDLASSMLTRHLELAELICESRCNPQLKSYDEMVRRAQHIKARSHDDGTSALTEFGAPAWKTVGAVYTPHFRVGLRWQCSKCGHLRKWGDD